MAGNDEPGGSTVETELNRDIGLVGAISLGVGTMIAAGIFVLSGLAVGNVGAAAIIAFLAAAVVASFTAFAYAEFASIYPESGGGYMYVANVFETDLTYIVGWSMILGYPASAAFYLASFSDWFYRFIYPALNIPAAIPFWVSGVAVLGLLVGINLKGTEETGMFQVVVTALKVVLILFFLYGGLQAFDTSVVQESLAQNTQGFSDLRSIGVTSALVFITFFGFEAIATNAEEIEEPGSTVPRAIFISMGLVTVIYTLVVLVIVFAIDNQAFLDLIIANTEATSVEGAREFVRTHGELAMGYAAEHYLGGVGFYVIIVGALISMVSAANATILAGSRVKLAMARRDHLPQRFEELHDSLNTPYQSVLLTGGLILFYVVVFTVVFGGGEGATVGLLGIESLTHFADFMLLGGLVIVNLAIIRSRRQSPDVDRGFEVPLVPWVPIAAVIANLVLLVNVEPKSFAIGLVAEGVGVAVWYLALSGRSHERIEEETPTVLAEHEPSDRDYRLIVPISNPDNVEQLMRTAVDVASENDGDIVVMSAVELPAQTPLSEGTAQMSDEREVVSEAMKMAQDASVPVSGTVRIGHDASKAILNTIEQYEGDAVLLGWRARSRRRRDIIIGRTADEVVEEAPCDVLVEKVGTVPVTVDSILLPTAGGPHAELAAEVSRAIARSDGATVRVVHVVDPGASESEHAAAQETVEATADVLEGVDVETELLEDDNVADAVVAETAAHDLTIIGATRESFLQQLVFGAVPEEIGDRAENTVIMTKRSRDIPSRVKRWVTGNRDQT